MSELPKIADKSPARVDVVAGKKYAWCACGLSKKQPLCDGSHSGTGFSPVIFEATKDETKWFCCCKQSSDKPFCDGTHSSV